MNGTRRTASNLVVVFVVALALLNGCDMDEQLSDGEERPTVSDGEERPTATPQTPGPDSCRWAKDGVCDEALVCPVGTDTTDCAEEPETPETPESRTEEWTTVYTNREPARGGVPILTDVAWNGDIFVAVGGRLVSSRDGETWTVSSSDDLVEYGGPNRVVWNGTRFVAVGGNGVILHSDDGEYWTLAHDSNRSWSENTSERFDDVIWDGHRFIAVGKNVILTSVDGDRWTKAGEFNGSYRFRAIAWNGERYVIAGGVFGSGSDVALWSKDGIQWVVDDNVARYDTTDIIWNGELFVATGLKTRYSADGVNWEESIWEGSILPFGDSVPSRRVAWNGTRFVGVVPSSSVRYVIQSLDGVRWTEGGEYSAEYSAESGALHGITWADSRFVAVGVVCRIVVSPRS